MSPITPTEEQRKILDARGRVVMINARAGTGKTATLLLLAEANADKKILYLVFNSRNRQEARDKFPRSVDVHTVHSFALSSLGAGFDGFGSAHPSAFLKNYQNFREKESLARLTSDFIIFFLNSTFPRIEMAAAPFQNQLNEKSLPLCEDFQTEIIETARAALNGWYKTKKGCPHDFYLKLSHLQGNFQGRLARYDLVLVDEGQDLSPVMIDALSTYRGRIVIVGDSHQQIYSFRYAEDAMRKFKHDELLELTMSFRFGEKIAAFTREFIRHAKNETAFAISGLPGKTSRLFFYNSLADIKNHPDTAILCRTNFSLFKNALHLKAGRRVFIFERDIRNDLFRTLDVFWLKSGDKTKIKDDLIRSFIDLQALENYANTVEDYQLLKTLELVNLYAAQFPAIVFEFVKLCEEKKDNKGRDAVILSTVHAAKGQEYENVVIDEDIVARLEIGGGQGAALNGPSVVNPEEINIAYVGMTRARNGLYLPVATKRLFSRQWQDFTLHFPISSAAGQFPPVQRQPLLPQSAESENSCRAGHDGPEQTPDGDTARRPASFVNHPRNGQSGQLQKGVRKIYG